MNPIVLVLVLETKRRLIEDENDEEDAGARFMRAGLIPFRCQTHLLVDPFLQEALRDGEKLGLRYALQIPQVAASGIVGSRLGRRAGSSIDFQDYREYQPGDRLLLKAGDEYHGTLALKVAGGGDPRRPIEVRSDRDNPATILAGERT